MERILGKIWTFLSDSARVRQSTTAIVRKDPGYYVDTYQDLVTKVSEISFRNPEYVLFFRGQANDYLTAKGNSTLHCSIFRKLGTERRSKQDVLRRFAELHKAEQLLAEKYESFGKTRVARDQILRWSIIQHYEIFPTPLLDVTHSLRVGASFAHARNRNEGYLYVLGLPQISGSITTSSETQCQIVRLLSICPPAAARPHFQEGYLLGEYPTPNFIDSVPYRAYELDFGRRLIAKFRLSTKRTFWDRSFPRISRAALYPDKTDQFISTANAIKHALDRTGL